VSIVDAEMSYSGENIQLLIENLRNQERHVSGTKPLSPEGLYDPFGKPDMTAGRGPLTARQRRDRDDEGALHEKRSREELISSLVLQGTVVGGDARLALIDGRLFAENDAVGRFRIVRIGELTALLTDDVGDVMLKMKGADEL